MRNPTLFGEWNNVKPLTKHKFIGAEYAWEQMPAKVHTHGKIILAYNNAKDVRKSLEWVQMLAESEGEAYMLDPGTRWGGAS